jgi:hypothetical protein
MIYQYYCDYFVHLEYSHNGVPKTSRKLTLIPYNLMLGLFYSLLVPMRLMLSVVGSNLETI